jgi:hypothetical protein
LRVQCSWFVNMKIWKYTNILQQLNFTYCNVLVGSISRWNFIALKVQYTTLDYIQSATLLEF